MIISASRRTDIPAFYADWLFCRIHAGFVCVRSPMNPHKISKIKLTPDVVDGFVFWTKNPALMLVCLQELKDYAYYFQFTLTPYGKDIEPNLPDKGNLVSTFQRFSDQIGDKRVVWRYDPILINPVYTTGYHLRVFEEMAKALRGYTCKVIISFLDTDYRNVKRNTQALSARELSREEKIALAGQLAAIARAYGMEMNACTEALDLRSCGIMPACCIDGQLMEALLGSRLQAGKDKNQRPACGCTASVDIGMYNTCGNGCIYCYANYNAGRIGENRQKHNPASPLLFGEIGPLDKLTERVMKSCREDQIMFDGS